MKATAHKRNRQQREGAEARRSLQTVSLTSRHLPRHRGSTHNCMQSSSKLVFMGQNTRRDISQKKIQMAKQSLKSCGPSPTSRETLVKTTGREGVP